MRYLITFVFVLMSAELAWSGDRVLEVQSRVGGALAGILDRNEFLVVVNRIESLEAGNGPAVAGMVKSLPGLRVGVDEEGQVVLKEGQSSSYSGAVSITVVLDSSVKPETYRAIELLLPEIMGGSRGGDEIKIKRAVLKQPPEEKQPQVVINNAPPQIDPKQLKDGSDFYKFAALFLCGVGALFWLLSQRRPDRDSKDRSPFQKGQQDGKQGRDATAQVWQPQTLEAFDPLVSGLYLMKCLNDNDVLRVRSYLQAASPQAQRSTLSALPAWCAAFCLESAAAKEGEVERDPVAPEIILRELSVMERSLKGDPTAIATALILWTPVSAMEKVHPESLGSLSDATRYAILSLRPELGRSFNYDEHDAMVAGMVFNSKAIVEASDEMMKWRSRLVVSQAAKTSVVDAMAGIVNRVNTFEEVETKLRAVQKKLSRVDWEAIQTRTVSLSTFETMNDVQKKSFLRITEAADFFYLLRVLSVGSDWQLDQLLRPKRLASYRAAETLEVHASWSEDQQKAANSRLLANLRTVCLGEKIETTSANAA